MEKISAGICLIFRALFFEHNAEGGRKDHLWTNTSSFPFGNNLSHKSLLKTAQWLVLRIQVHLRSAKNLGQILPLDSFQGLGSGKLLSNLLTHGSAMGKDGPSKLNRNRKDLLMVGPLFFL